MEKQNEYMIKALEIAFDNMGLTSPNPAVGAVIVKDKRIISTGGTEVCGKNHAEICAIQNAEEDLNGAEIFVSLEPCCHHGKTPPCTDAIIKSGIIKVHIPLLDPNSKVAGKGVEKLQQAGIEVEINTEMEKHAYDLLRPFSKYILEKKPFVINKCAMSIDGMIAAKSGDSKWISSGVSRFISHKLRSKVDAIIIGKNTFQNDLPGLNVRLDDFSDSDISILDENSLNPSGRDNFFLKSLLKRKIQDYTAPLRVIIGFPENFVQKNKPFYDDNYLIFVEDQEISEACKNEPQLKKVLDELEIHMIKKKDVKKKIDLVLDELYNRGVMFAMLEGGSRINGAFLNSKQIDQIMYFIAPKIFGSGIPAVEASEIIKVKDAAVLNDISTVMIGEDVLYTGYI